MSSADALSALYPFLSGREQDADSMNAALLESVRQKARESCEAKTRFFETHAEKVVAVARAIADVYRGGGRLFCMGNGGSSCAAAHIAVEFLPPAAAGRPALPAVNLNNDVAMLTAVANDVGYKHVYVRQ